MWRRASEKKIAEDAVSEDWEAWVEQLEASFLWESALVRSTAHC